MAIKLTFSPPWESIPSDESSPFEDEYAVEIAKGHGLYGVPVKAVARRRDCDDVLFCLLRHLCDYAVVHLTWTGKEEENIKSPAFELFVDDDDLMEKCIIPTSREYTE